MSTLNNGIKLNNNNPKKHTIKDKLNTCLPLMTLILLITIKSISVNKIKNRTKNGL
jgi:hypothetical protein